MDYRFDLGAWNSVFAVPSIVVDKHIKLAGAAQLKVILWMLRHSGENFEISDISKALSMHEADVRDSMQYWVQTGVVAMNEGRITPAPLEDNSQEEAPKEFVLSEDDTPSEEISADEESTVSGQKPRRLLSRPEKPDLKYLTERMNNDPAIACLMQSADEIFGRITSNNDKQTLLLIHEYDGLPVEVILMLLQYAYGIGKTNMRYIEKMAISWVEEEIFTLEAAENKIKRLTSGCTAAKRVQIIIGAEPHSPTENEIMFASRWIDQWRFSDEIIRAAYEACVDAKGKYLPKYTNSILERWYQSGVRDAEQLRKMKQSESSTRKQKKAEKGYQPTYDISEYESTSIIDEEWNDE